MNYLTQNLQQIQTDAGLQISAYYFKPANFIINFLPYLFGISGIILIFNIVTSGFKLMTSRGEPKAIEAAQSKITTSLIGILILFASFWIINLVMKFFGISFGGTNLII